MAFQSGRAASPPRKRQFAAHSIVDGVAENVDEGHLGEEVTIRVPVRADAEIDQNLDSAKTSKSWKSPSFRGLANRGRSVVLAAAYTRLQFETWSSPVWKP